MCAFQVGCVRARGPEVRGSTNQSLGSASRLPFLQTSRLAQSVTSSLLVAIILMSPFAEWVEAASSTAQARNVVSVGHMDIEGGGMVDVQGTIAAIGHLSPPLATTILDVTDPAKPRILSRIKARPGTHSHKARMCGTTLITNVEQYGMLRKGDKVGLAFYDISDPRQPKEMGFFQMGGLDSEGTGAHRFQADCERKLIYTSGSADGFQGNIAMIVDFSDPRHPRQVGRWWVPGQYAGGGERATFHGSDYRTHHPLRLDERLYVSLWYGGFAIVNIENPKQPRTVSLFNYHPVYAPPTHTALPVAHKILGRKWLLVFDEAIGSGCDDPSAFMWVFDITDERTPLSVSTFQVASKGFCEGGRGRFGAHQPHEQVGKHNLVYAAWFSGGLRVIDISNPYRPEEVGYYVPTPGEGCGSTQSNDVFVDKKGLIYLIDRCRGLDILKFTGNNAPTR